MSVQSFRVLIIIVLNFVSVNSFAQTDSISLDQLQDCVRGRLTRGLEADLTELEYSQKGEWIKYLPNIGVTYTVAGQPRPAVSTSTNVFYQAKRDRKEREAAKSAAIKRSQLQIDTELATLNRRWNRYQVARQRLDAYNAVAEIDRDLFKLFQQQYDANEILPEVFLTRKMCVPEIGTPILVNSHPDRTGRVVNYPERSLSGFR
jgi:hypothetical protein